MSYEVRKAAVDLKAALYVILDAVDYTTGQCRPNEPVGGVLPKELIEQAWAAGRALTAALLKNDGAAKS